MYFQITCMPHLFLYQSNENDHNIPHHHHRCHCHRPNKTPLTRHHHLFDTNRSRPAQITHKLTKQQGHSQHNTRPHNTSNDNVVFSQNEERLAASKAVGKRSPVHAAKSRWRRRENFLSRISSLKERE